MKKLPRKKSPLVLHQEAIRVLTAPPLAAVVGGGWTTEPSNNGPSGCPGCISL